MWATGVRGQREAIYMQLEWERALHGQSIDSLTTKFGSTSNGYDNLLILSVFIFVFSNWCLSDFIFIFWLIGSFELSKATPKAGICN